MNYKLAKILRSFENFKGEPKNFSIFIEIYVYTKLFSLEYNSI